MSFEKAKILKNNLIKNEWRLLISLFVNDKYFIIKWICHYYYKNILFLNYVMLLVFYQILVIENQK